MSDAPEPGPEKTSPEINEVSKWLTKRGFAQYADVFAERGVTFDRLAKLTEQDLKDLGVSKIVHRANLLTEIGFLNQVSLDPSPSSPTDSQSQHSFSAPKAPTFPGLPEFPGLGTSNLPRTITSSNLPPPAVSSIEPGRSIVRPTVAVTSPIRVAAAGTVAEPAQKKRGWKRFGGKFLIISIVIHLLFGTGAAYYVVQTITAKRKLTFKGGPPTTNPGQHEAVHRVQMAKKKNTMSAPAPARRITSTGISKVALPAMPSIPNANPAVPANIAGMTGGVGVGVGVSVGTGNSHGGGGGPVSFFGLRQKGGASLEGTFYDFRMQEDGHTPVEGMSVGIYTQFLTDYNKKGWQIDPKYKHFTWPVKLYAQHFLFPAISSTEAGKAFQSPTSPDGLWIAHYKGIFGAPDSGTYRFVGFGDNVMFAKVGDRLVLDASDHGYLGLKKREPAGKDISFPSKGGTPMIFGSWFDLHKGENRPIEIAVGDEGGIFCAGLFIQKSGQDYKQNDKGVPLLPLFAIAPITEADKAALSQYLPPECFTGPVFAPRTSIFGN